MKPYKAPNKRLIARGGGGRFRQWTGADVGIGGVCPVCNHLMLLHYDGDPREQSPDPRKFRYRCFTCEPLTDEEKHCRLSSRPPGQSRLASWMF